MLGHFRVSYPGLRWHRPRRLCVLTLRQVRRGDSSVMAARNLGSGMDPFETENRPAGAERVTLALTLQLFRIFGVCITVGG